MNTNEVKVAKAAYASTAKRNYTITVDGTAVEFAVCGTLEDVLKVCREKVHHPFEVIGDVAAIEADGNYYLDGVGDANAEFEIYLDCPTVKNSVRRYAVVTWTSEEAN